VTKSYPSAKQFIWSQEEHRNYGSWSFVRPRFENLVGVKVCSLLCEVALDITITLECFFFMRITLEFRLSKFLFSLVVNGYGSVLLIHPMI